ncbi:MAG: hypothetical protein WD359_02735 [Dehalococcoidia bacterium]
MSTDFGIDLEEVRRVIDGAVVLVVRFSLTDRRLLVDTRTNDADGPLVRVVPPVASGEERFKALRALRPGFPPPERILTFQWPRHARSLVDSGLWEHLARRAVAIGGPATSDDCEAAMRELIAAERRAEITAIRGGEGFKTLWERG